MISIFPLILCRQYKIAADIIRKHPTKIITMDDVPKNRFKGRFKKIGSNKQRMLDHIQEIIDTGSMEKLQLKLQDTKVKSMMVFSKVHGIGPKFAKKFADKGYRTIEQFREAFQMGEIELNAQQKIGLKYYEELQERIPRKEATEIVNTVKDACNKVLQGCEIVAGGSYRRAKDTCGDVDILIFPPVGHEMFDIIGGIYDKLCERGSGFLTDDLSYDKDKDKKSVKGTYMGICKLHSFEDSSETKHRRLDIKSYPRRMYPFALLYFTGSDHWNRSIRHFAKKKGFSLSDLGLTAERQCAIDYLRCIGKDEQANTTKLGHLVPGMKEEKDVFETLGLGALYKEPHERIGSIFPPGMPISDVNAYFRKGKSVNMR